MFGKPLGRIQMAICIIPYESLSLYCHCSCTVVSIPLFGWRACLGKAFFFSGEWDTFITRVNEAPYITGYKKTLRSAPP